MAIYNIKKIVEVSFEIIFLFVSQKQLQLPQAHLNLPWASRLALGTYHHWAASVNCLHTWWTSRERDFLQWWLSPSCILEVSGWYSQEITIEYMEGNYLQIIIKGEIGSMVLWYFICEGYFYHCISPYSVIWFFITNSWLHEILKKVFCQTWTINNQCLNFLLLFLLKTIKTNKIS